MLLSELEDPAVKEAFIKAVADGVMEKRKERNRVRTSGGGGIRTAQDLERVLLAGYDVEFDFDVLVETMNKI